MQPRADTRQSYYRDWMGNFLNTIKATCNKGMCNVQGCLDIRFRRERDTNLPANLVGSMHAAVFHPGDQRTAKATSGLTCCSLAFSGCRLATNSHTSCHVYIPYVHIPHYVLLNRWRCESSNCNTKLLFFIESWPTSRSNAARTIGLPQHHKTYWYVPWMNQ